MTFTALSCPQCGAALPRQARWRVVDCPYCHASVTRASDQVGRARFRDALLHALASIEPADRWLDCGELRFRILAQLAVGEHCDVFLGERMSVLPERVVIKLARDTCPKGRLHKTFDTLHALQAISHPGAAYFSQRLPQPVMAGSGCLTGGHAREVLVLRQAPGFWGSLDASLRYHPAGIDPRHAVWMWRRVLEVLGFLHETGWTHGDLHSAHWLVNPRDHGILLLGWGAARANSSRQQMADDIVQSAWCVRMLLCGGNDLPGLGPATPAPLAAVIRQASEDRAWCATRGAAGVDAALKQAAMESFGPPKFVAFCPTGGANRS